MEKVKTCSFTLLRSIVFSSSLLWAIPAHGQAYSASYPAPNQVPSEIYNITKTLNNKLLTTGVMFGSTADPRSSFPDYKDWRMFQSTFDGAVSAQRILSTGQDDRAFESVRATLGDMMIVGYAGQGFTPLDREEFNLPPDHLNAHPVLVKLSSTGTAVFQKAYEMGGLDDHAYSIVREHNNSYMILGRSFRAAEQKYAITLLNVDVNGDVLGSFLIHDGFQGNLYPRKMIRTNDGGFLIAAVRDAQNTPMMHAPDPVDATIMGQEIAVIKLNVSRQPVFMTLIRPHDNFGMGVKDMVEDNDGTVFFVGSSSAGEYAMAIDMAGTIVQSKLFTVAENDLPMIPKCIARISNGFAISGSMDAGLGVPYVEVTTSLNVTQSMRHQFGENINTIENVSGGIQFLAGGTSTHAHVVRWLVGQAVPSCNVQNEQVSTVGFPIDRKNVVAAVETLAVQQTPFNQISSAGATRLDNCVLAAAKAVPIPDEGGALQAKPSVSPIPAQDQLQVLVPGEAPAAYTLHDLQGRLLASGTLRPGSQTLPVADLARGVYVLRVTNNQLNSTHRISLQH